MTRASEQCFNHTAEPCRAVCKLVSAVQAELSKHWILSSLSVSLFSDLTFSKQGQARGAARTQMRQRIYHDRDRCIQYLVDRVPILSRLRYVPPSTGVRGPAPHFPRLESASPWLIAPWVALEEGARLRRPESMGVCVPVANLSKRQAESERELSLTGNH